MRQAVCCRAIQKNLPIQSRSSKSGTCTHCGRTTRQRALQLSKASCLSKVIQADVDQQRQVRPVTQTSTDYAVHSCALWCACVTCGKCQHTSWHTPACIMARMQAHRLVQTQNAHCGQGKCPQPTQQAVRHRALSEEETMGDPEQVRQVTRSRHQGRSARQRTAAHNPPWHTGALALITGPSCHSQFCFVAFKPLKPNCPHELQPSHPAKSILCII